MTDEPERVLQNIEAWKCRSCGILHPSLPEAEDCVKTHQWPKKTMDYLHGNKESNWNLAKKIGLSEEAFDKIFRGILYEISIDLTCQYHIG